MNESEQHALREILKAAREVMQHVKIEDMNGRFKVSDMPTLKPTSVRVTMGFAEIQHRWEGSFTSPAWNDGTMFRALRTLENMLSVYDALKDDGVFEVESNTP